MKKMKKMIKVNKAFYFKDDSEIGIFYPKFISKRKVEGTFYFIKSDIYTTESWGKGLFFLNEDEIIDTIQSFDKHKALINIFRDILFL